jgi:hypothetical protein
MKRKICILLLLLFNLQFFGCTTFKQIEKVERLEYSNSYLITVTVFPKGKGHSLIMNGVGDENHLFSFSKESIDDFFRSFYAIYAYSPLIVDLERVAIKTLFIVMAMILVGIIGIILMI